MPMINRATRDTNLIFMTEYIKNILYFAVAKHGKVIKSSLDIHFFTIDNELVYENFYNDFGPLNLGCVYKYCNILNEKLKEYLNKQVIVHYTSDDSKKKANAAFLLGCYGVLYLKLAPKEALKPLCIHGQNYRPFQDAVPGDSCYTITLIDCLNAIKRASDLSLFQFNDFSYEEYDKWSRYHGGDLTWIVPGKFIAFIGPIDSRFSLHPPEKYVQYFKENEVNVVIRLNERRYDANIFSKAGIKHFDLIFPDGSRPPRYILFKFLQISEDSKGAVAVHCKAGLGRTGSLIGCYLIKHYKMSAREAIGWMRICRPGSVIGHQQSWLENFEPWLLKQGNIYRKVLYEDVNKIIPHDFGIYSIAEKFYKSHSLANDKFPRTKTWVTEKPKTTKKLNYDNKKMASKDQNHISQNYTKTCFVENTPYKIDLSLYRNKNMNSNNNYNYLNISNSNNNYENQHNRYACKGYCRGVSPSKPPSTNTVNYNLSNKSIQNKNNSKRISKIEDCNRNEVIRRLGCTLTMTPKLSYSSNCKITSQIPSNSKLVESRTKLRLTSCRRRLGRSPSPPPSRQEPEHRATNTPVLKKKSLRKDSSIIALREALSKLRVSKPRDNSVGMSSLGARNGPSSGAPRRSNSARSDEQPLATQGDMLNSIKFQRRLRQTVKGDQNNQSGGCTPRNVCNKNKPSSSRGSQTTRLPFNY